MKLRLTLLIGCVSMAECLGASVMALQNDPDQVRAERNRQAPGIEEIPVPDDLGTLDPLIVEAITNAIDDVREQPLDPEAWLLLAQTYHAHLQFDEAEASYERCLALDESMLKARYCRAVLDHRLGRSARALKAMQQVQEDDPEQITTYWHLAGWLFEEGDLDAAADQLRRGRAIAPEDEAGAIIGARIALQRDENEEAAAMLEPIVAHSPENAYAHFLLGTAYRNLRRLEDAEAHLNQGRDVNWKFDDPWMREVSALYTGYKAQLRRAKLLLDEGRVQEAIPQLEKLREQRPDEPGVLISLGGAYRRVGRLPAAIALLNAAISIEPNAEEAHFHLASAYRQQCLEAEPDQRQALLEKAMMHVDEVTRLSATWAPGHALRGELLAMLDQTRGAVRAMDRAMELDDADPLWPQRAGAILIIAGQYLNAIPYLEKATELEPHSADSHLMLAEAHANAGDLEAGLAVLRRFDKAHPGNEKVDRGIKLLSNLIENKRRPQNPAPDQQP